MREFLDGEKVAVVGAGGIIEVLEKRVEFRAVAQQKNDRKAQTLRGIERAGKLRAAGKDLRRNVFCGELRICLRAGERSRKGEQSGANATQRFGGTKPHGLFFGRR